MSLIDSHFRRSIFNSVLASVVLQSVAMPSKAAAAKGKAKAKANPPVAKAKPKAKASSWINDVLALRNGEAEGTYTLNIHSNQMHEQLHRKINTRYINRYTHRYTHPDR